MPITNTKQTVAVRRVSLVSAAFIIGVFLLLFVLLLQIPPYARGAEVVFESAALTMCIIADACFFYVGWRGGWVARVFALPCGLAALLGTFGLFRWTVILLLR